MRYILKKLLMTVAVLELVWLVFSYAQVIAHQSDTFNSKEAYRLPSWNAFSVMETIGHKVNGGN